MLKKVIVIIKNRVKTDLGLQVLALYLLFLVPIFFLTLAFYASAGQRLRQDFAASDLSLARIIALEAKFALLKAGAAVESFSKMPAVIEANPDEMAGIFAAGAMADPDVNLFYRLSGEGVMLYHYPPGPASTVGQNFSSRDYFQAARNTQKLVYSKGRISATTGRAVVTSAMPIVVNGHFEGVVAANIELQRLAETIRQIGLGSAGEQTVKILIVDDAGQVIAASESGRLLQNVSDLVLDPQVIASSREGWTVARDKARTEWLYSYTLVPQIGWTVIVQRPTWDAFASLSNLQNRLGQTLAFFGFGALLFWLLLVHWVIVPLELLTDYGQTVGQKKDAPSRKDRITRSLAQRNDQIGQLTNTLLQADHDINQRLRELTTLNETSASVVSTLNFSDVLNRIFEQLQNLLGITQCAVLARDKTDNLFRIQAGQGLSERYTRQLAVAGDDPGFIVQTLRTGKPVQINDVAQYPRLEILAPGTAAEGIRSILAIPLRTVHAAASVLLVFKREPHYFSEREINLLTSFANHAAMAIENATLYAQSDARLREQTSRLEALIQSLEDGLILEDLQGNILYANRTIVELTRLPEQQIIGSPITHWFDRLLGRAVDQKKARAALGASLKGTPQPIALSEPTGVRYLRFRTFTVTDADGQTIGRGQIVQDITNSYELDRMKSSLISTVSHELRTPLAAIKGYASTLLADDVAWAVQDQRDFLNIISVEADRLSELVNNLLDISRIEAGNLPLSPVLCELPALLQQAAQRVRPHPGERLQADFPSDLPSIFVDPHRIEVVLRNLIENAVKYAPDDSPVRVSAAINAGEIIVRVQDQGPGIASEHSRRIFESFYRVDSGLVRRAPGAGLGLAICQGFVQAHGGKIWLEPQQKGTCIAFTLPASNSSLG
ncbi:MAG: ATP-binding protein [Chloroflexota bacterium]